jgi:hypothetical protein
MQGVEEVGLLTLESLLKRRMRLGRCWRRGRRRWLG